MNHSFKIIRGGQWCSPETEPVEQKPTKVKYVKADWRKEVGDRIIARFHANRDRAIDRELAKQAKASSAE